MSFADSPASDHAKLYKNNSKSDDSRRRRTETSIEIRRQKRNDEMMKRRNLTVDLADSDTSITSDTQEKEAGTNKGQIEQITVEKALQILTNNPSIEDLRRAFEGIRKLLSRSKDPPIDEVINSGLVEALVRGLSVEDEKVQFEAAWSLTNITSGSAEQTMAVVSREGATKSLVDMCNSNSVKLAEQAIWAVANIVGEGTTLRDHVIEQGIVLPLNNLMNRLGDLSLSFVRTLAWTYSNLVRHKNPQVPFGVLKQLAPGIAALLKYKDLQVQQDSCWALSYFTDGADENIELAYQNDVVTSVVAFLTSRQDAMIAPALRVLGNFATGNDDLTQVVVDSGVLATVVPSLLKRANVSIVKESCWLISNVVAGTNAQIQEVIDAEILPLLFEILKTGDHRSQFEASWAIANIAHGGSPKHVLELAQTKESIDAMCSCLSVKNNELIVNILETLYSVLKTLGGSDPTLLEKTQLMVEELGGLDQLEKLQTHESEQIYELSYKIVNEFFNDDTDDEDIELYDKPLDLAGDGPATPFNF